MNGRAYYNEHDPYAAAWLRNLIAAGHIAPGDVDERSIALVQPGDVRGYSQCHFFAGIGGWSLALRLAGWPDDRPVWTGSCPCQPFSAAGKRLGTADERHLWPEFARLIAECRPAVVAGEQVASKAGREWLARVRADLESMGYAVGAADLCAASVGAPHIRQRLYWVADANQGQRRRVADGQGRKRDRAPRGREQSDGFAESSGAACGLADPDGRFAGDGALQLGRQHGQQPQDGGSRGLGDASGQRLQEPVSDSGVLCQASSASARQAAVGADQWRRAEWYGCLDGKARRGEPGIFPLAHGVSGRVGKLRGAGNAIVPQVAAEFITAYLEAA